MPIFPPANASAYDTATTVLNMTRARVRDQLQTLQPTNGKLLDLTNANTQQAFNTSWRKAQEFLGEKGYARLINEVVISSLPVVGSTDPAAQCWLSWSGYYDGANLFAAPSLPSGFNHPIKIWERWSGQNAQFSNPPMEKMLGGLPSVSKSSCNRCWEWRNDAIYMPGSQVIEDLRIRYVIFLPDLVDVGTVPWWQQPVQIVRIADGLSWLICAELAMAKGDMDAYEALTERGHAALLRVFNLDVKADQFVNVRRQARSGRSFGR